MKVTIVGGAGVVGSASAFRIAQDGYATEIVLMDSRRNLAEAHSLDIEQAVAHRSATRVFTGEVEDAKGSDIIIMTAGVPHRPVLSRAEFLSDNLPIVFNLAEALIPDSPLALWIIVSVPVDPLVYLMNQYLSIPRQRIIGLNWNDSSRFRWAIAKVLSIPATDIEAFVLGEHGDTQVPIFSQVRVRGERFFLNDDQIKKVQIEIQSFFIHWNRLQSGRTAGWNSAESIGDIVASIASSDGRIWVCSTILEGEYGLSGVSLGVPVKLTSQGVQEILKMDLDASEKSALKASADAVKEQILYGQLLLEKHKPLTQKENTLIRRER